MLHDTGPVSHLIEQQHPHEVKAGKKKGLLHADLSSRFVLKDMIGVSVCSKVADSASPAVCLQTSGWRLDMQTAAESGFGADDITCMFVNKPDYGVSDAAGVLLLLLRCFAVVVLKEKKRTFHSPEVSLSLEDKT